MKDTAMTSESVKEENEMIRNGMKDLLHSPKMTITDVETHIGLAASLARALWTLVMNHDAEFDDKRDRYALIELASLVAEQASAANYAFHDAALATRLSKFER